MRRSLLILAVSLVLAAASGARAGEDLVAMTNSDRGANGLRALVSVRELQSFAQRRAEEMARAGKLWHAQDLGTKISNWKRLGENIGRGGSVTAIQRNFMASPSHRDNILYAAFSEIGVGVAKDAKQYVYVAVVFREPATAPARSPAPAPAPAPGPAPAPRPRPAPARRPLATTAPKPKPAPAPTTTTPPTTVPPAPVAAPAPPAPEPAPALPPSTTVVQSLPGQIFRPRPVFENPDFLAANFLGTSLPPDPAHQPDSPLQPAAATMIGLVGVFGGVHAGTRRWLTYSRAQTRS